MLNVIYTTKIPDNTQLQTLFNKYFVGTILGLLDIFILPVHRPPGGHELRNLEAYPKNLKTWKIHHIRMILSLITYPLSPRIKPIYQVYANVSELPPPLLRRRINLMFKF